MIGAICFFFSFAFSRARARAALIYLQRRQPAQKKSGELNSIRSDPMRSKLTSTWLLPLLLLLAAPLWGRPGARPARIMNP